jgi:putative membrane protein
MLRDHGKSSVILKDTLLRANVDAAPAGHLDDRRQGMIDDLRGASGRDFDTRYLDQQVGAHQEAKILLRGYARSGDNGALKRFAQTILPKVQTHLTMAVTAQNALRNRSAGRS